MFLSFIAQRIKQIRYGSNRPAAVPQRGRAKVYVIGTITTQQVLLPDASIETGIMQWILSSCRRLNLTVSSAEDTHVSHRLDMDDKNNELDRLRTENNEVFKRLRKYEAELAYNERARDDLKKQLAVAQMSVGQERHEKSNLVEILYKCKNSLEFERAQKAEIQHGKAQCEAYLKEYEAQAAWSREVHEQLEGKLAVTYNLLGQERAKTSTLSERLQKFKILLKSEQAQRAEVEESKALCEAFLEEKTAHRLLGIGINIQGTHQTLPEIESSIRQALTITVSEWVEQGSQGLVSFSKGNKWFIPQLLAQIFTLCKENVDGIRQHYVNMFLGNVEGAVEENMEPDSAQFMRNHLQRHHLTLFPGRGINRDKACRLITTHLAGIIAGSVDGGLCHGMVNHALAESGVEKIMGQYIKILASCAVQHPTVSFSRDCHHMQSFDKKLHFEPVDGDGDLTRGGECMVIFPALLSEQGESLVNKRFVLGPQEQAWRDNSNR